MRWEARRHKKGLFLPETTMSDQEIRKEEEMEEEKEEKEISTLEGGNTVCEVMYRGERIEWYLKVEIC